MAYKKIVDIDGTLTITGDTPNQPLIDYLNAEVMAGECQIIIVSARPVERLEETRAWLQEHGVAGVDEVHLNDFEGAGEGPAVGLAFKAYKYAKLIEQYGLAVDGNPNGVKEAIDNDAEVRAMARRLGLEAYAPEEVLGDEERAPVNGRDKFTTQKEAQDRAKAIGCEGTHTIDENGQTIYMPCATHAAYDALVNQDAPAYRAPAPPSEQITGSENNPPGSAAGQGGNIELSEATQKALQTKADDHNKAMRESDRPTWTNVRMPALEAVYRRGSGAYSTSFRPGIGRAQWSMARVNAFLFLARTGAPENAKYVGDNDLLNSEHPRYAEKERAVDIRAMVAVPNYISAAATAGLEAFEGGLGGDGLQPATVREARQLAAGEVSDEKAQRMGPWVARHRGDWEGVPQNSDPKHPDWPGPGAVAALLWGVNPVATNGADRVIAWADKIKAEALQKENNAMAREQETRAVPLGEFRLSEDNGQKVFSGYAALFGTPSAGLPFTEIITPGAFKRTLGRVAQAERVVKFLHGHDQSRMLASTASGRLTLTEDSQGLRVEAKLDPADPDAAAIISKLTHEAAAMGMSFGFTVPKGGDAWEGENRTLREVNLFEVSILSGHQPAYPATLGLSAVRKVAEPRIGVAAERLISTLEAIKAGKSLSPDEVEVIDAVRSALAPKSAEIEPSIARARLRLAELQGDDI